MLIYTIGRCTDGDKVNDTPAEATAYMECDCSIVRDTCPTEPGFDPIHNHMDYACDKCRTGR
jgi:hypothetical protein